jgi:diguanylate cyclase (GGDEF)-like protein
VTEDPRGRERLPWLAEVLAEDAGAEQALRALAERARDARAFEALARRLHEVDARRVELLEKLAARELELEHLATIDAATETLNRRGIEDAVLREVEAGRRSGGTVAACLVVCEGHEAGDEALRAVADRVKRVLRVTDAIGRVGGDELLVLLPQTRMAEALLVADRAAESVAQSPVLVAGERIGVNVGVAVLPWETSSLDEVVAVTRQALAQRRRLSDAPRDDGAAPDAPLELIARLARGEGLRAVFQPILHVADETIAGYEVLVRGPEGPYEAPEALLGLARQCGVLAEVDLACLRACLEHARKLPAEAPIHLNLCPTTLTHLSAEELVALFAGVATAPICLELSEDRFVGDAAALSERIAALRSAGVRLAIDDVGRGRGTLESVMVLEPDMVKIDRELILGACRDVRKERLLRRLVAMAATLGCAVVGEGVEHAEDLELLRELDVPYAQGFLWAAPQPAGG